MTNEPSYVTGVTLRRALDFAVGVLSKRGVTIHRADGGIWWEEADGTVRTFAAHHYGLSKVVLRLHLDHYALSRRRGIAQPGRPKAEVTIVPSQIGVAIGWLLGDPSRGPDNMRDRPFPSAGRAAWDYQWSATAAAADGCVLSGGGA